VSDTGIGYAILTKKVITIEKLTWRHDNRDHRWRATTDSGDYTVRFNGAMHAAFFNGRPVGTAGNAQEARLIAEGHHALREPKQAPGPQIDLGRVRDILQREHDLNAGPDEETDRYVRHVLSRAARTLGISLTGETI